ncbi:23.6 kDa heat shock protein, mitochondrial-like [Phragmites australis]|uniref:23.6 kDa heat shock protein, mitochondrial-like n=1 Tax=Phragmites australis TaxID=29695 RepID=UPI002D780C06|nr:23.6 kDa heat shock protein, mitochondrial-like [Phragmites australis]
MVEKLATKEIRSTTELFELTDKCAQVAKARERQIDARLRLTFDQPASSKGVGRKEKRKNKHAHDLTECKVVRGIIDKELGERKSRHDEDGEDGTDPDQSALGYHASLLLPADARAEGITAEARNGVLYVTVPRTGERKRNVTEVKVQ